MERYLSDMMKTEQTGITLIEVLLIVLIISVGMAATAKFQAELFQASATTKVRFQALALAQSKIESLKILQSSTAGGSQSGVAGEGTNYDIGWGSFPVAGFTNTVRYTATVTWKDSQNRSHSVQVSTLFYAGRMTGGYGADAVMRAEAARCVFLNCDMAASPSG
ncbi:type IV pilus modification PilV family protein [Oceanospirillum sp.]|uniref:type IV pilus modification PilV family protein n=1 Tax=Oceanospirillum sp. TaxID=2021254 RepID=UPI003A9568C6